MKICLLFRLCLLVISSHCFGTNNNYACETNNNYVCETNDTLKSMYELISHSFICYSDVIEIPSPPARNCLRPSHGASRDKNLIFCILLYNC